MVAISRKLLIVDIGTEWNLEKIRRSFDKEVSR